MIVTYRRLGQVGRLGNQMWQMASTIGVAEYYHAEVRFPNWDYQPHFNVPPEFYDETVEGWADVVDTQAVKYLDPRAQMYLQDYRFIEPVRTDIRRYFSPSMGALDLMERHPLWQTLFKHRTPTTAVHIRRGDVLAQPNHFPMPSQDYYRENIDRFADNVPVFFSDDIATVREQYADVPNAIFMPPGWPDWLDLQFMAYCEHHIIANSTFSWWAAFLADDTETVYPKEWFGPAIDWIDPNTMMPPEWNPW